MAGTPDAQYRWFVGLSQREALAEAVDRLRRPSAFLIEPWGVVDAPSDDPDLALRIEVRDRAYVDGVRENVGRASERADHVLERAIRARPLSFLDLLTPDPSQPRRVRRRAQ
jgi:hypothetical protein